MWVVMMIVLLQCIYLSLLSPFSGVFVNNPSMLIGYRSGFCPYGIKINDLLDNYFEYIPTFISHRAVILMGVVLFGHVTLFT